MCCRKSGLTNNQLKIIAVIAMLCDHVGKELLVQFEFLQIIGRIALPIFAYMIAEGCLYTRNRRQYLMKIALLALGCQLVYFIAEGSLYQNILVTFSLSVLTVFTIDNFRKRKDILSAVLMTAEMAIVVFLCIGLQKIPAFAGFRIDYGIFGVLLPVAVYFAPNKPLKIIFAALTLIALSFDMGGVQWFSLAAVPLIMLYNEKRGKLNLKYLFYIFYPSHLAVIYLIKLLLQSFNIL